MLHLPARDIPVPTSVSPEAQQVLSMGSLGPPPKEPPALDDVAGWRAFVEEADGFVRTMIGGAGDGFEGTVEERDVGPCPVYVVTPREVARRRPAGLPRHPRRRLDDGWRGPLPDDGGDVGRAGRGPDLVGGLPDAARPPVPDAASTTASRRTGPLLEERRPEEIVVGGVSAGGNLAAALLLRARDEGLPLPAAVVLQHRRLRPHLQQRQLAHERRARQHPVQLRGSPCVDVYVGSHDLRDPYVSPMFGDLTGFPPAILLTGTRDLLLSDNVRMHRALRAAGVAAELHVWEAAGHGGFLGMAPEDAERFGEVRRFVDEHWARPCRRPVR